jgi:hypothetical protein
VYYYIIKTDTIAPSTVLGRCIMLLSRLRFGFWKLAQDGQCIDQVA